MKPGMFVVSLLVSALAAGAASAQPARGENVNIYAAAVAKAPLTAIAAEYEKATGNKVTLIFPYGGRHGTKISGGSGSGIADHYRAADSKC